MASERVKSIQRALKAKGHDIGTSGPGGDGVDGDLGKDLEKSRTLKSVLDALGGDPGAAVKPTAEDETSSEDGETKEAPANDAGGFAFGERSLKSLKGVHPDLVKVATRAIALSEVDFMVIEGVRTPARQKELYAQGRTKPGKVVTWTLNSNHFVKADGFGYAIDCLPAPYDWKDTKPFDQMAKAMFAAAAELNIPIRWGADWDRDGKPRERGETDSPHFELWR